MKSERENPISLKTGCLTCDTHHRLKLNSCCYFNLLSSLLSCFLCVYVSSRMRRGRCSVQWGGLLLLLSSSLLCVDSQGDPQGQQPPPVVESAAHITGHGRLDKNMVQDKEWVTSPSLPLHYAWFTGYLHRTVAGLWTQSAAAFTHSV